MSLEKWEEEKLQIVQFMDELQRENVSLKKLIEELKTQNGGLHTQEESTITPKYKTPKFPTGAAEKKKYGKLWEKKTASSTDKKLQFAWRRFSTDMIKNPFVRKYKKEEQNDFCMYCHKKLEKDGQVTLHHIDYNHNCLEGMTLIDLKNGDRNPLVPDCEKCFKNQKNEFDKCMSRIHYVHQSCHNEIHEIKKAK